ncbi:hypothetical protein DL89DRAFT_268477 [Linderina pennispora]|uniref:RING-type domain-containing protein n=1 Tax=Linderina pennispora TaxID=61395 RepID=A0A1Y1W584_9FUNG|nr:uncharacterized protein DL89DRAFT_268477 [Linderina pennispora]ORX68703.1 hypothetical protein DL89DRAFT_268477 [Linderina pennispora]
MRSPQFAFDECFDDECSDEYTDNDSSSSSRGMSASMVSLAPRKPQAQISSYTACRHAAQDISPEHVYPEMHGWSPTPVFEHPQIDKFANRSFPGSPRLSLHSSLNSDSSAGRVCSLPKQGARPGPSNQVGDHWDDQTPVRDIESECVPGVIRYRDQRSQPTPGFDSSDHSVPIALRTAVSQIECSSRSVGDHVRELPCKHKYHLICIDTWLVSRSTSCPYCKMDIRRWYYGPDVPDAIPRSGPLSNAQHMPIDYNGGPIESVISIPDDATMAGRSRWGRVRAAMRRAFEPDPMMT